MKKFLVFNGGRGSKTLIKGLVDRGDYVVSVLNAYDDGKSTGWLRRALQILGPSDIRKTHEIVAKESLLDLYEERYFNISVKDMLDAFEHKFEQYISYNNIKIIENFKDKIYSDFGDDFVIEDMSLMNLWYAAYFYYHETTQEAINAIEDLFEISNLHVVLNSEDCVYLNGLRIDGVWLKNEADIVELRSNYNLCDIRFARHWSKDSYQVTSQVELEQFMILDNTVSPSFEYLEALKEPYSAIIFGPGTQHSSLYPTYLTRGTFDAIKGNSSSKIFIVNIGADYETPGFSANDYLINFIKYLKRSSLTDVRNISGLIDRVFVNNYSTGNVLSYIDKALAVELMVDIVKSNFSDTEGKHDTKKVINSI